MTPKCQCGKPVDGATLCSDCTTILERTIADISAYAQDLPNVLTKQTRYGDRYGGRRSYQPEPGDNHEDDDPELGAYAYPLPLDLTAVEVEWVARNTVTTWCRVILEGMPGALVFADTIPSMCRFLLTNINRIRVATWGAEAFDELTETGAMLQRTVDRLADQWYAGPCGTGDCDADLYAQSDGGTVTCPDCGAEYDVADRRAWLLAAADDRLETATVIARAVVVLGDVTPGEANIVERIKSWAGRNRIRHHGGTLVRGQERPLYRVGDVLDLLAEDARKAAHRRAG